MDTAHTCGCTQKAHLTGPVQGAQPFAVQSIVTRMAASLAQEQAPAQSRLWQV